MHETANFEGDAAQALDWVRGLCLGYPEATEVEQFGHPWFKAGKRPFAIVGLEAGQATLAFAASKDDQDALCKTGPFWPTPYMHQHGWTSCKLDGSVPMHDTIDLIDQAYRSVALKRMLKALEDEG